MAWVGFLAALTAILLATLAPASDAALVDGRFFCLSCGDAPLANLLRNVILFLPLGFFAFHLLPRLWAVTLGGFALSWSVETLQVFIPGRNPLVVDLIANTVGAALGGLLAARAAQGPGPRGARRRRFAVALAVALLMAAAPAWLLVPAPPNRSLWAHWNPSIGSGAYDGSILHVRLGDMALPAGPISDDIDVPGRLRAGHPVSVTLRGTEPVDVRQGIFRIISGSDGWEVVAVSVHGPDVLLKWSYRADRWGLAGPRVRATRLLDDVAPGDTVVLSLTLGGDGEIRLDAGNARWHAAGADPSMGWSLLYYPEGLAPWGMAALGFLWCGLLLFAPAFLAPGRLAAAAAGVALLAVLVTLGAAVPLLAPLTLAGWAGAVVGWASGRVGRWSVFRPPR